MNKRKLLLAALALCMVAILAVGGSLAYLTDTDEATNVFTIGDIQIKLNETNGEGLVDDEYREWAKEQTLLPGTKTDGNAIPKIVTVTNTGKNDAYMWIEYYIPAELDGGADASDNDLHVNFTGADACESNAGVLPGIVVDGVSYVGYIRFIDGDTAKSTGQHTDELMTQVYMDYRITSCTEGHEGCMVLQDGKHYEGEWNVVVKACGIQADGFTSIQDAIAAFYGLDSFEADQYWK